MKFLTLSTVILVSGLALKAQQPYQGTVGRTLAESKEWWPAPVKPPAGSPNVIWILLDDVGFGATSTFGGVISTPTFDSLANNGLRYTNFHTAAICAPTRAALMTGRNTMQYIWADLRITSLLRVSPVMMVASRPVQGLLQRS
ncbi:sulfatase-like hydrolase/transferase [Chitinophaga pinensis]|uniref:sulfatase-like hydrolase/transferase n=1 Tax=Chitinophaga pinensis TaxID=79329 RepID=UPI0021BDE2DB|nr:sulfatase-like hydrolase/transferase [Chitinophaga pinensis]